jgi:hypothetical protein
MLILKKAIPGMIIHGVIVNVIDVLGIKEKIDLGRF